MGFASAAPPCARPPAAMAAGCRVPQGRAPSRPASCPRRGLRSDPARAAARAKQATASSPPQPPPPPLPRAVHRHGGATSRRARSAGGAGTAGTGSSRRECTVSPRERTAGSTGAASSWNASWAPSTETAGCAATAAAARLLRPWRGSMGATRAVDDGPVGAARVRWWWRGDRWVGATGARWWWRGDVPVQVRAAERPWWRGDFLGRAAGRSGFCSGWGWSD